MSLGMNVAWINSWANAWVFSNLMYHATMPTKTSGTSNWTYDQGLVQVDTATDTFRIVLADHGDQLPFGEYTVLNPDGLKISIGGWNPPSQGSYTTATQYTFNHTPVGGSSLCLHFEGNVTANNGNLAVILPGHLTSWNAGSVWNEQFLDFHRGLKLPVLRFMDWTWASQNIETEWADRAKPDGLTFHTPGADNAACVPYELICDLAGILNTDVWVCSPVRASADYIQQMAALFDANLPVGRKIWLEHGNEVWNSAVPWGEGTAWMRKLTYTKRTSVADFANQKFLLSSHGITNGTRLTCHATMENRRTKTAVPWQFGLGTGVYVKSVDADSFEVYGEASLTTKLAITVGTENLMFSTDGEAGKSDSMNASFGETCLRNWNIFDGVMGEARVVRLLAAQVANPDTTVGRLAVPGVAERASAVAVAPYYSGTWFGGSVDCGQGSLTPRFWASDSYSVHMAVYASGATPTPAEIIAGTGAINKQSLAYAAGPSTYTAGTSVTGLVDGTAYSVHFVYVDSEGAWAFSVGATPSATPSTVYAYDSYENQAIRNRLSMVGEVGRIATHKGIAGDIPVMCYEGGLHFHHARPPQMNTWIYAYQESAIFGDVTQRYLTELASAQSTALCYYGDSLATNFSIANGFHDTEDVRYQAIKARGGRVAALPTPTFQSVAIPSITTEPSYPYSWYDFGDAGYTYEIIENNGAGNYTVVGSILTLSNGAGINWGAPGLVILKIRASNDHFTRVFTVSFSTGNAWYEADSKFVWDSKSSADNSQISPVIGNTLARSAGSGALISNGLWDMSGNVYNSPEAAIAGFTATKPILLAAVLDKAAHGNNSNYKNVITCGSGNFMAFYVDNGALNDFRAYGHAGGAGNPILRFAPQTPEGPHVFWIFYDPTDGRLYAGYDQVGNGSVAVGYGSAAFNPKVIIGGSSAAAPGSRMKHGSMQILNREGMTRADAMAIVAKMQAYHGIG